MPRGVGDTALLVSAFGASSLDTLSATVAGPGEAGVEARGRPGEAGVEALSMLVNGPGEEERDEGWLEGCSGPRRWKVKGVGMGWTGAELRVSVRRRLVASFGGLAWASSCLAGVPGDTLEPSLRAVGGVM